jgi:16S rRNA (guanine527-N7)-methyltransferase
MRLEVERILQAEYGVSRETIERLAIYEALLQERGRTLNLVGRSTLSDIWQRHFLDSAQLWPLLAPAVPLLDMGTGAGFPGMVLAIMGMTNVHLSDNNQPKAAFLHEVATATGTLVTIHNCKVEALPSLAIGVVTARALTDLTKLLALGERFFAQGATGLFLKGAKADDELASARREWQFSTEIIASRTADQSSILRLAGIKRHKVA